MLNRIVLMGRLTKDPELRQTNNGVPVVGITLAVDRNYVKDKERETDFIDVVAWQNKAEFVYKHFSKGQVMCVEGRLQRRQWEDNSGSKRYAYEVIADEVYFSGPKKGGEQPADNDGFDPFGDDAGGAA